MNRHRLLFTLYMMFCCHVLVAQNTMRVHYKDGTSQDISISQIDSVTFVRNVEPEEDVTLSGEWLWGQTEAGYYELISFSDNYTYTCYDLYFAYGFDTMTYGWYSLYGNILSLQSNGYGYERLHRWYLTGLSGNALSVMTKWGPYTYYKVQPEIIHVSTDELYTELDPGDEVVFADGVVLEAEENKLFGIFPGTTFILVRKSSDYRIYAYMVTVN